MPTYVWHSAVSTHTVRVVVGKLPEVLFILSHGLADDFYIFMHLKTLHMVHLCWLHLKVHLPLLHIFRSCCCPDYGTFLLSEIWPATAAMTRLEIWQTVWWVVWLHRHLIWRNSTQSLCRWCSSQLAACWYSSISMTQQPQSPMFGGSRRMRIVYSGVPNQTLPLVLPRHSKIQAAPLPIWCQKVKTQQKMKRSTSCFGTGTLTTYTLGIYTIHRESSALHLSKLG